jgi:Tol biopolymer transport system component
VRVFNLIKNQKLKLFAIALAGFLSGCGGYPRLLSYPFDAGGRSLNSPASELTPKIAGRYIVFTSDRFGGQDVYLFDAADRNLINLPGLNSFDAIASHPDVSAKWSLYCIHR